MNKEKPILFSTPMVKAILQGRKTVTRRVLKMTKDNITDAKFGYTAFTPDGHISMRAIHANGDFGESFIKCPYGKVGDMLWVRETFSILPGTKNEFYYKANGDTHAHKWKPSLFMPKEACRLRLKITGIKVERLQDISEDDAIAEGIEYNVQAIADTGDYSSYPRNYLNDGEDGWPYFKEGKEIESFKSLWQSINGPESWESNPWVWAISFKKL